MRALASVNLGNKTSGLIYKFKILQSFFKMDDGDVRVEKNFSAE